MEMDKALDSIEAAITSLGAAACKSRDKDEILFHLWDAYNAIRRANRPAPASPSAPDVVEADTTLNHEEAEQLAQLNKETSNLARCYLDLRAALSQPKAPSVPEFHQLRLVSGEHKTELLVTGLELLKTKAPEVFLENRLNELFALHVRYLDHVRRHKAPTGLVEAAKYVVSSCIFTEEHPIAKLRTALAALSHNGERSGPIHGVLTAVIAQREEICKAFIAKYGCEPDEVEQVERRSEGETIWSLRHKAKNGERSGGDRE